MKLTKLTPTWLKGKHMTRSKEVKGKIHSWEKEKQNAMKEKYVSEL